MPRFFMLVSTHVICLAIVQLFNQRILFHRTIWYENIFCRGNIINFKSSKGDHPFTFRVELKIKAYYVKTHSKCQPIVQIIFCSSIIRWFWVTIIDPWFLKLFFFQRVLLHTWNHSNIFFSFIFLFLIKFKFRTHKWQLVWFSWCIFISCWWNIYVFLITLLWNARNLLTSIRETRQFSFFADWYLDFKNFLHP